MRQVRQDAKERQEEDLFSVFLGAPGVLASVARFERRCGAAVEACLCGCLEFDYARAASSPVGARWTMTIVWSSKASRPAYHERTESRRLERSCLGRSCWWASRVSHMRSMPSC